MCKKLQVITFVGLFLLSVQASADNRTRNENINQVSRYVTLMAKPTSAQRNPLRGVIPHIHFRNNVKTVGQAIRNVLKDSGYRLARYHPDKRVHKMFALRLPNIHRNMGPISLWETLEILAGEPWELSVDPIRRLISFELPANYQDKAALKKSKEFEQYRQLLEKNYQKQLKAKKK